MGLWNKLYKIPRAQEKIRPLLESRMMRDILLEVGQRGVEPLDPQSVPLDKRARAAKLAGSGAGTLLQSAVEEVRLDASGITLFVGGEPTTFLYADYNYEDIEDTDCLPAVAQYMVQHLRGYYNIRCTYAPPARADNHAPRTQAVSILRHHEDTPFDPGPAQKQKLF